MSSAPAWPPPNPFRCEHDAPPEPVTVVATSPNGIRELGRWMRQHDPATVEPLAVLAATFGASELSYSGDKQDDLRAHMRQWRERQRQQNRHESD